MEKFPEDFNRSNCIEKMRVHQAKLIIETRKSFYESIINDSNTSESTMVLQFPDKMWFEYKHILIDELLKSFGKLKLKIIEKPTDSTLLITNIDAVPVNNNIKLVTIEFPHD